MDNNTSKISNLDIDALASKLGYSYLDAGYGYWEDGGGKIHHYDSMDNNYIRNCKNFIDRGIKEIKEDEIVKDIKRQTANMLNITTEDITKDDLRYIKKELIELLKSKKEELKNCRKRRR